TGSGFVLSVDEHMFDPGDALKDLVNFVAHSAQPTKNGASGSRLKARQFVCNAHHVPHGFFERTIVRRALVGSKHRARQGTRSTKCRGQLCWIEVLLDEEFDGHGLAQRSAKLVRYRFGGIVRKVVEQWLDASHYLVAEFLKTEPSFVLGCAIFDRFC